MIDTIIAKTDLPNDVKLNPDFWKQEEINGARLNTNGLSVRHYYSAKRESWRISVQFEFTKLLQDDQASVWVAYKDILRQVNNKLKELFIGRIPSLKNWRLDRVDFCHDYDFSGHDVADFLRTLNTAVENQRYIKILYQNGETFYLRSKAKRPNFIRLYDKCLQVKSKEASGDHFEGRDYGNTLRIEHQMINNSSPLKTLLREYGALERSYIRVKDVVEPSIAYRALELAINELGCDKTIPGKIDARKILRKGVLEGRISKHHYNRLLGAYSRCIVFGVEQWKRDMGTQAGPLRKELRELGIWPPTEEPIEVYLKLPKLDILHENDSSLSEWPPKPIKINIRPWIGDQRTHKKELIV